MTHNRLVAGSSPAGPTNQWESLMFKVHIIESERGWGSKVDDTEVFETEAEREKFIAEYNAKNNLDYVPDIYWYAVKA